MLLLIVHPIHYSDVEGAKLQLECIENKNLLVGMQASTTFGCQCGDFPEN